MKIRSNFKMICENNVIFATRKSFFVFDISKVI